MQQVQHVLMGLCVCVRGDDVRTQVQRFVQLCRSSGGVSRFRWNEQAVQSMVWQLLVPKQHLHHFNLSYRHRDHSSFARVRGPLVRGGGGGSNSSGAAAVVRGTGGGGGSSGKAVARLPGALPTRGNADGSAALVEEEGYVRDLPPQGRKGRSGSGEAVVITVAAPRTQHREG